MPKKKQATDPLQSLFDKGVLQAGSDPDLIVTFMTSGIPPLDAACSGGIPVNRHTLIAGEWSTGKTLLVQKIAAAAQAEGKRVVLVDAEMSFDPVWWATTGVDVGKLAVAQPSSGEEGVDLVADLVGQCDLILIDSLAALIPLADQEKSAEDVTVATQARLLSRFFKKTNPALKQSGTAIVSVNQVRTSIGGRHIEDVLPGGRAQQFYASIILRLRKHGWITNGDRRIGFKMGVQVWKNKVGTAHQIIELPFLFDGNFDLATMVIVEAIDEGVIIAAGPYYRIPVSIAFEVLNVPKVKVSDDWTQVMGRANVAELFAANPAAMRQLEDMIYARTGERDADGWDESTAPEAVAAPV